MPIAGEMVPLVVWPARPVKETDLYRSLNRSAFVPVVTGRELPGVADARPVMGPVMQM